jgi:hypothetical protein
VGRKREAIRDLQEPLDRCLLVVQLHAQRSARSLGPLTFIATANARTSATELPGTGVRRYRLELAAGSPQV